MLTATQALQQTQQNELVMKKRELGDVEKAINTEVRKGNYYCYEQIRFPETIAKLRENGFKVTRDSSELGFKIYWDNSEKFENEEEQK